MTVLRMDHVTIVVEDLPAAIAFFKELGLALEGQASVEGAWVDQLCGLDDTRADIAMMRTPDGHSALELTRYRNPPAVRPSPAIEPPNTFGIRQVMFAVDDIDDTVARLKARGATLVREITQYEDMYRLCYLRGPEGIIVALAEAIG